MKKYIVALFVVFCMVLGGCAAPSESPQNAADLPPTEAEAMQIYYDFFKNNFEIIEYEGMHGSWRLWGHVDGGETRTTKQVYLNRANGFDYPVLVLSEFTIKEDGITINGSGRFNAYIIKNGVVTSELNREEFDAIFNTSAELDGPGWGASFEGESFGAVDLNGEQVFFFDFAGDVREDGSMDTVLAWFEENAG